MNAMEALECPVCLNTLDQNHKVLSCQHTFCTNCLEILHDGANGHVRCPECRTINFITSVAHLPTNVVLMRLLQSMDDQAKKEEEKAASSSDDEPAPVRKKIAKPKKKFRKIRSQWSDSDEEPVIKDSESESEDKKPVIQESESDNEKDTKPAIQSESDNEKETKAIIESDDDKGVKYKSDSSSRSSSSSDSDSSSSEDTIKDKSGSDTDNYFSDSEKKKDVWDISFDIVDPLASTPNPKKERKRSGRLAERNSRVFQMPSRKSVLDSIPSTSSPEKACITAKKYKPRRRVNNFTKINSSYNNDPDFTGSDSCSDFIKDGDSEPSDGGSYYSDDSTKKAKKKKPQAKRKGRSRRKPSLSESEECTESYGSSTDTEVDEYVPPKKKSRIKQKPQISEDERWESSDSEKYCRLEPKSKRQRKKVKQSIHSESRFEQLKRQRQEDKWGKV